MNLVNQGIMKHKEGLLNLTEELKNVSQACRIMGVPRDTFCRVKEAKDTGGPKRSLTIEINFVRQARRRLPDEFIQSPSEEPEPSLVEINHRIMRAACLKTP